MLESQLEAVMPTVLVLASAAADSVDLAAADSAYRAIQSGNNPGMLFAVIAFLYFVPWFIAVFRKHRNAGSILVIDLFLGWTLIGWVVALAWAVKAVPETAPIPKGAPRSRTFALGGENHDVGDDGCLACIAPDYPRPHACGGLLHVGHAKDHNDYLGNGRLAVRKCDRCKESEKIVLPLIEGREATLSS